MFNDVQWLDDDIFEFLWDEDGINRWFVMCFNIFSDIDECTIGTHNCDLDPGQATCTNTVGSFTCTCNTGYAGNGVVCNGL